MAIKIIPFNALGAGVLEIPETILNDGDIGIILMLNNGFYRPVTLDLTPLTGATAAAFIAFASRLKIEGDIAASNTSENYWKESANLASVSNADAQKNTSYDVFYGFVSAFKITSTGGQTIIRGGV